MKIIKPTVSIGIPAFNEEANISYLIKDLLIQKYDGFTLDAIIISSDGSTDATVSKVKKIKSKKLIVLDNKDRKGRILRQTQIMQKVNSDILVLLDADIQIKDSKFLEKIINPMVKSNADLTSVSVEELPVKTLLGRILDASMKYKKYIFENYNRGNNLYTCHGRARAFSKKLYKKINFKNIVAEDAYSYMYAVSNGFKYQFVRSTQVFYKLPESFDDHEKQSIRFFQSMSQLENEFGHQKFTNENYLNTKLLLKALIKYIFINPLVLAYFLIALFLKLKSTIRKNTITTWTVSTSSKVLRS